jgi:hypothetical protein
MIDLEAAERALKKAGARVPKAAAELGVKSAELRRAIALNPRLMAIALEAAERSLDRAERIILDGLDSPDKIKRLEAAVRVLKGGFRGSR